MSLYREKSFTESEITFFNSVFDRNPTKKRFVYYETVFNDDETIITCYFDDGTKDITVFPKTDK